MLVGTTHYSRGRNQTSNQQTGRTRIFTAPEVVIKSSKLTTSNPEESLLIQRHLVESTHTQFYRERDGPRRASKVFL